MALPIWTHATAGIVTFSKRGQVFPVSTSIATGQVVGFTDGLRPVVTKYAPRRFTYPVTFVGLPNADFSAVDNFLWHPDIDGMIGTFTYTDEHSVSRVVRWIVTAEFTYTETSDGRYAITLTLRQES